MVSLWYLYDIKYVHGYIKYFLNWPLAFSLEPDAVSIQPRVFWSLYMEKMEKML